MFSKKFYLKLLMGLLLFAFIAPPAAQAADEILTVANGSGQSRIAPIFGNWCDTQGTYSVMLYPSSILTEMDGKDITGLKFYPQSSTAFSGTFTVSICETELTYVNANNVNDVVSNPTVVKTGLVLSTGLTSIEIPFDDSYPYGGKNLVVKITLTATGTDANTYFVGETQTSTNSLVYTNKTNQDSKNFIPKTTFTYSGEDVPYAANVTPQSIAFGKFTVGTAANTQNVTLKNKGTNAFTPSVSVSGTNFSTTYTAAELAAGASVTIPVTFNPATAGNFTGTLTISCGNGIDDFEIPLTASAVQEVTAAEGTATDSHLPVYGLYYDEGAQTNQMIYPASMLKALNGKKITSMTFYTSATSFISGGKVTFSLANLPAETAAFSSAVRLTPNDLTQVYSSAPNVAQEWTITFSDNANFVYNGGNLLIDVQTESGSYKSMSFTGESGHTDASWWSYRNNTGNTLSDFLPMVTFTYEESGVVPPTPVISGTVTPTSLDFGTVTVGENGTATITVANTGNTAFTPEFSTLAAPFSIEAATEIAAGASKDFTVTYHPTAAGNANGSFTVTIGEQDPITVTLTGSATTPVVPTITVNPTTLNINAVVGETKTASFTVTGTDLSGDITVAASEGFTVSPATIAAADAANGATVTVSFTATEAGTKTGTITLTSTGAETKTVSVYGTATEAGNEIFTVDEESLDFGNVMVGESKTLTVKVTNKTNENINPVFTFNNNVFSVEDDSYPVYGGLSQTYNIIYAPAAVGTDHGTLTIRVGSQSVTIDLTGNGAELAGYDITSSEASGVHNFGDVFKDGIATWNVTLTNNGANAVTPVIEGLAAPFSAENVPATIPAGESATITIKFAPTAIQAYGPTSIVVKFNETEDFQFDYTLRGNGIENTGTLPPSTFDNETYTWTDDNGDEHTSPYSEIATDPNQMIALLKAVYTNKNIPGNYYRGYTTDKTPQDEVAYPAIGAIERNYTSGVGYTHDFYDAYGWGMAHDETAYPMSSTYVPGSTYNKTFYVMNPNEYKPNQEGVTLLLVEMKDGVGASTTTTRPTDYASLKNLYSKMFKSVRVIPNSKKVTKTIDVNGTATQVPGTLFKVDCDKMNRFFFLAKGRLRFYPGEGNSSAYFLDQVKSSGSGSSYTWYDKENTTATVNPFNAMYEQFSPVDLNNAQESSDVYQLLINMESYDVEHDCEAVPWASTNGVSGHEFNMYGKTSISDDCQDVRDLMFFVPDYRMMYWSGRDKATNSDEYTNYYKQFAPNMGMYVIVQNDITGEKIDGQDTYKLHLTWDSNLTDFVPADKGLYYIYQVNEDGSYTKVGETDAQTKELYLDVNMAEHGQQVTYVIQGLDNTGFLSLQFSNEESFIIPGTNPDEKFQLEPNADIYSRFNPADGYNYYANGLQLKNYVAGLATSDLAGKKLMFYRQAVNQSTWTKVAEVTVSGTTASAQMFAQRAQSDYIYGFKTNPELVVSTTGDYYNFGTAEKPFMVYDNLKDDVSLNIHPDGYRYKVVVDGTPDENDKIHSNVITVKVYKTKMSNIAGSFDKATVDNDTQHLVGLQTTEFDIDVEHSSKTEILRYGAYRWTQDEERKILNGTADAEEDISPSGQASNQGEYYSVYMNGDTFIGEDVYVSQGQPAQATFEDNYPEEHPNAYVYAPVIETFTGRADYNTYGAPLQNTATGTIELIPGSVIGSSYDFIPQSTTGTSARCRYYLIPMTVNVDIPTGYEIYKVRAWRQVETQWLGEEVEAYFDRISPDYLFETLDEANKETGVVIGSFDPNVPGSADVNVQFGAKKLADNESFDADFIVRVYFTKAASRQVTSADDKYYIMESKQKVTIDNKIITGVINVNSEKQVAGVKYYNLMGVESNEPFNGVNIVVTRYTDGSISTSKVLK